MEVPKILAKKVREFLRKVIAYNDLYLQLHQNIMNNKDVAVTVGLAWPCLVRLNFGFKMVKSNRDTKSNRIKKYRFNSKLKNKKKNYIIKVNFYSD